MFPGLGEPAKQEKDKQSPCGLCFTVWQKNLRGARVNLFAIDQGVAVHFDFPNPAKDLGWYEGVGQSGCEEQAGLWFPGLREQG